MPASGPEEQPNLRNVKNHNTIRFAALGLGLLLPATLAFMPTGASIRFAPEEGLTLTKTFVQSSEVTLESMEMMMGDETQEVDELPEININSTETIVFEDTYDSVGDERPTQLTRHFVELGRVREQSMQDESETSEETSELVDTVVIYSWDDDEEAFSAEFDEDSDGDEDLLESTWCDADLLGFLPDGEVDEGDTWEVDIEAWRHVLEPGGDLTFLDDEGESSMDEIDEEISASLDGDVECEFKGFRDEDGVRVAVIAVTVEVEGAGDSEEEQEIEPNDHVTGVTQSREVSISSEYEGELLWAVEAGHLLSLSLAGETSVEVNETVSFELTEGDTFEQSQLMTFGSETEIEFTFE